MSGDYDGCGDGEDVVWWRQTIDNACGLYGLLHGICNGESREYIRRFTSLFIYCLLLLNCIATSRSGPHESNCN